MRFFKISITTICLVFCLFISSAIAADVVKIGIIDLQKILSTSDAGKEAQQKIVAKGKELEADLQVKGTAIEEGQARYEREAKVVSKDAQSEKERELKIKVLEFQDLKTKYEDEMKAYQQELIAEFQEEVLEIIDHIGKIESYLVILEKNSSGVVYAPSSIDLTDQVIQQYNEDFTKK